MSLVKNALGTVVKTHVRLYQLTNGAVGAKLAGLPCLLLTTTGAKSGIDRTVPLGFAVDKGDYVLVASNNGADQDPAWLVNLTAEPHVTIQVKDETIKATARVVRPNEPQYDRLFGLVNERAFGRYYRYQQKTMRPLPVVVLLPTELE